MCGNLNGLQRGRKRKRIKKKCNRMRILRQYENVRSSDQAYA